MTFSVSNIDTRQGTANQYSLSHGNCLPYTGVPFGMNFFTVQTKDDNGNWYFHPKDPSFQGFRLTHQPSPWVGDFSTLLMSPVTGPVRNGKLVDNQTSYRSNEATFNPHHIRVIDLNHELTTELTPTTYGAAVNTEYNVTELPGMFIRAKGTYDLTVDLANNKVFGFISNISDSEDKTLKMYVTFCFDQAIMSEQSGFFDESALNFTPKTTQKGENLTLLLRFSGLSENDSVSMHMASSFLSQAQADLNLSRIITTDFDTLKEQSGAAWQQKLDLIDISNRSQEPVDTFYTCMYRAFLFPQRFFELNEQQEPMHYDTLAKTVKPGFLYTNNGFWDTYKTVYPLFSLLIPTELTQMLAGFLTSYREAGFLPKWLSPDERGMMPGTLIDAVIADAAIKGIGSDMMPEFLEAMKKAATVQSADEKYGRRGTLDYLKYGYVPNTHGESVNHTLDYVYSDFCIAQVAKTLGATADVQFYQKQATNYRNIFDPSTGFMRSKDVDGHLRATFEPTTWGGDYTEGSAWQSSFAVYHDVQGLIDLYGSSAAFNQKITALCNAEPTFSTEGYGFQIHEMSEMAAVDFGQLAISNQPSFHIPYLFTFAGHPENTQVVLKEIMTNLFNSGIEGFPGDEDNGSMASWYLFSSMGFYPVCPGTGEYVLGIPLFDQVTLHLPNQKKFILKADHNYPQNNFVKAVQVNSAPYDNTFITHQTITAGGSMNVSLSLTPAIKTITKAQLPYSLSK